MVEGDDWDAVGGDGGHAQHEVVDEQVEEEHGDGEEGGVLLFVVGQGDGVGWGCDGHWLLAHGVVDG